MLVVETAPVFLPEKEYALGILLRERLRIPFRISPVAGKQDYTITTPEGKILLTIEDHFFGQMEQGGYLELHRIPAKTERLPHPFTPGEALTLLFGQPVFGDNRCGIDLVASAFFMLTRWEEFVRPERDRHGRFPAAASLAAQNGFLEIPVVDEYVALLANWLSRSGFHLSPNESHYTLHLSHDVDHPLLWWRAADRIKTLSGSLLKRKNPREFAFWLRRGRPDPFDSFDWLMDVSERRGLVSHFNFLGERATDSDCWYPFAHPFVQQLIKKIAQRGHEIGFHPSYEAFDDKQRFLQELGSVRQAAAPATVRSGRQHYLRFAAPFTWQMWSDAGMETDSTMGYAETPGFRCGTCHSFPVFNFLTRQVLPLRELPLVAMDVSFALYRNDSPEEAAHLLGRLREQVRKHRGVFTLLWHNSSLDDYFWRHWKPVYETFVHA